MDRRRRQPARHRGRAVARAIAADARAAAAAAAEHHPQHLVVRRPTRGPGEIPVRQPSAERIYRLTWHGGNSNDQPAPTAKFLPLPPDTPSVEGTWFLYLEDYGVEDELTNLEMKVFYERDCNAVGDKRRELIYYVYLSKIKPYSKEDRMTVARLALDLEGMMEMLQDKIANFAIEANIILHLPDYFTVLPPLE